MVVDEGPSREEQIFAFLCRKYVQRADSRHREMGLQYMEAETHDLARALDTLSDNLDESCKHGFADWRNCATCRIRNEMYGPQPQPPSTTNGEG